MEPIANRECEHRYLTHLTPDLIDKIYNSGLAFVKKEAITQHYIAKSMGNTVRLRRTTSGSGTDYVLCVKGSGEGINELQYYVDLDFARPILDGAFNTPFIEKTRHTFDLGYQGFKIEIDVFHGELTGLIIAEIEVPDLSIAIPDSVLPDYIKRIMTPEEKRELSNYGLALMDAEQRKLTALHYKQV